MESFGTQLSNVRRAKGLTQEQLAERLAVSRTNISRWESGRLMPDLDTIKRLSQILEFNFFTVEGLSGGAPEASLAKKPPKKRLQVKTKKHPKRKNAEKRKLSPEQ